MTNDFGKNWPERDDPTASWSGQGQPEQHGAYGYGNPAAASGNEADGRSGAPNPYYGQDPYGVQERYRKPGVGPKILAFALPILALAGGVGLGYVLFDEGVDADTVASLESDRDELQRNLDDSKAQVESRDADIRGIEQELESARLELIEFEEQGSSLAERESFIAERENELDAWEEELDVRESDLDDREEGLGGEEGTPTSGSGDSPTITEGVWTVGLDIDPGTYRVTEAIGPDQFCYWAIYESGTNQQEIITNSIPTGGFPTVTLEDSQDFETSDCGTWEKM